ncbi:serine/threonine protein kinase [Nonomuraea angiospora]|uniref:Ser/Thr protein kinase n=1 Tax=Nonomuraea angiospora TaxID=46172 RepID=A0ABR9LP08_9ACTN|nr:serine/threonine-protein kinase [Nonomuraea angiospora]MBE1581816.1 putative Ser/Thr protein kinase [Nonomuraea angiospora]
MPPITELRAGDPSGLGGYEIRGRLGEGVQGVVYLGVDERGRQAAVKWLRPELAGHGAAAERFAREVAAARRVAPFCTAKVLDSGVHEDRPYIVSEYVDGPALERAVREEGPRTGPALHRLAIGTATALAAIHQAGIVHRDFNPGNVLLGSEGPRVIGFGIARALDVSSGDTTVPVGDSAFPAPEQLLGDPAGPAADLFAWACTIVFAASGAGPFAAGNLPATVQRVLNAEPDLGRLTGTLRDLVAACLSKDPARRPTAEQVIHRLLEHPTSNPDVLHQAAATFGATPPTSGPSPAAGAPPDGGGSPVGGAASPGGGSPAGGWSQAGGAASPGGASSASGEVPRGGAGSAGGEMPRGGAGSAGGEMPRGGAGSAGGEVPRSGDGSAGGGVLSGAEPVGSGGSGGGGSAWRAPGGDRAGGSGPQAWAGQPPYSQPPYPPPHPPVPPAPGQYRPLGGEQPPPPAVRPGFEPPAPFQHPGTPPRGIPYGGPPPPPTGGNRRNWLIGGAIAGVALVAAIAIVVVTVINLPPKPQALPTPVPANTTTSPTASPVPTANLTPVRLPDTDATVYESPDDPVRLTTYMVRDAKSKDWVYYARDSLTGGFTKYRDQWESMLSPDGRYLAQRGKSFTDHYDSVVITDKTTGERFSVRTSRQPLSAYLQAWSRDSTRVLVNVGNPVKDTWQSTGFAIVDVTTRKAKVASLRESSLKNVRYGFDDTDTGVVAMSVDAQQQALRFFDASGLRVRRIPNVGAGIADELFSPSGGRFVTNCPGLQSGNNCVYDSRTGAEVKRIESACGGLAAWFDDDHLFCWVRPDAASGRQQVQVIDFTGTMVRLLAEIPTRGDDLEVVYTLRKG